MNKGDKQRIKTSEKEYRNTVREKLIGPLNKILINTHKISSEKIINCLENEDLSDVDAYNCKKKVEEEFGFKMERYKFFVEDFGGKVDNCLAGCRNDFTLPIVDCYDECLRNFRGYLDEVRFE